MMSYASIQGAALRQACQIALSRQITTWKDLARDAIGASASIGLAVGGAAATAAVAVSGLAQGIVQGASSAVSSEAAIMPPPAPNPDSSWDRPA